MYTYMYIHIHNNPVWPNEIVASLSHKKVNNVRIQQLKDHVFVEIHRGSQRPQDIEPQGSIFEPICQHLTQQQRYGDLYRLMQSNRQIEKKCRPYLDQLIVKLRFRNPNELLQEACYQHDKALYDLSIQLAAINWNRGLIGASQGGHLDLVKLMIKKGAQSFR